MIVEGHHHRVGHADHVCIAHVVVGFARDVLDWEPVASHRRDGRGEQGPEGVDDLFGVAQILVEDQWGKRQVGSSLAVAEHGLLVIAEAGKSKGVGRC